ncbi:hypothetical protein MBLNU13_g02388t1 [Cladosporium sp. NU13]
MSGDTVSRDSDPRLPGSWTESNTTISPVERVINIVELCEQILEYLPCADLRRARCVCRQFDAVIKQSKLMRLRSPLRLRSNQIAWASPTNGTLLTGIYTEDHMAARRAEGRATGSFNVYEMHPFLRVDHGTSYIGHGTCPGRDGWVWSTGHHDVLFGDLCLTQIPDDFALDDERICQPLISRILVSMHMTHFEEISVNNDDGITFGDIRRAVKEYLSD